MKMIIGKKVVKLRIHCGEIPNQLFDDAFEESESYLSMKDGDFEYMHRKI